MLRALLNLDFKEFEKNLIAIYASIAYNNFTGIKLYEYEGYYVSVFYSYIKACLNGKLFSTQHTNQQQHSKNKTHFQTKNAFVFLKIKALPPLMLFCNYLL